MAERIFSRANEVDVTRAILKGFVRDFENHLVCDAVVIGAGPAGLVCARELAANGKRVLLMERNNYLGGGFWIGGFLMNTLTVRSPGDGLLREINVKLEEVSPGLFAGNAPEACSKLIASTLDAGVWTLNMASLEDLVLRKGRVEGVVINWTPVQTLPRQITCVDPVALESKVVVDATGHEAYVCGKLHSRGLIEMAGMGAMNVEESEDAVVEKTSEVFPGLIACGMSVSTVFGVPRMGPTFGGMLLSGKKAGGIALDIIDARIGAGHAKPGKREAGKR